MSPPLLVGSLLKIAKEDLAGATILAAARNRNAIYLCEQAAEKVIRAVLTAQGTHAGTRHHLDEMVEQVVSDNPAKAHLHEIEHLGAYATSYRYPTSSGRIIEPPDWAKVERDLKRVGDVLRLVATQLGVHLG